MIDYGRAALSTIEKISKPNVYIEKFNPDASGTNLSTQSFVDAINYAKTITRSSENPANLILSAGTYRIKKVSDLLIPSLRCIVGFATIIVEDDFSFLIDSNFELSHVKIVSKNTYNKADATFKPVLKATKFLNNVSFDNVVFDSELSVQDGSVRASVAASLKGVNNLKLKDITVNGYRYGIQTDGLSNGINGRNLNFYNVELPLYMRGGDPAIADENYAKNIQFSQITHINTKTQSQNYFKQAGADTFLFEKCDTFTISDVIAEWPIERTAYYSSCRNSVSSIWNLKNALGIKFVGKSDIAQNVELIAKNCKISAVHAVFDDAEITQQGYIAEFYWTENCSVKGCTINGNGIASVIVSTRHYVKDLTIEFCEGSDLKRGLFEYEYVGDIINPAPTPNILSGNYTAGVDGLTIRKNRVKNSNVFGGGDGKGYYAIKLSDVSPPSAPAVYRYKNLVFEDNRINNLTDNFGIATGTTSVFKCKGLFNIDSVDGLRVKGNTINGYYVEDTNANPISLPFQVGSKSKNVSIKHEETLRNQDFKYNFGNLFMSADSEIKMHTISRLMSYQDTAILTIKHDQTDVSVTKDVKTNFRIKGKINISDTNDFSLPIIGSANVAYPLPNLFGTVDIITDNGDIGGYIVTKAGVVSLKSGSSPFFATATADGKFAFFKDTSPRYLMRFKLGATNTSFIVDYSLSA